MSVSPWDTSGPSQIADPSFYLPEHRRGRGKAPSLTRGVRAAEPKQPKARGPMVDVEAIKAYIAAGHTARQAAPVFGCCERTIRHYAGPIIALRKHILPGRTRRSFVKRAVYFEAGAWAWILANGGTPFLRKLVDNAMGAQ